MVYIDDDIESIDLSVALNSVSPQRRTQVLRYRQEHDRKLSLAAYILLCHALRTEYGIAEPPVFTFDANGKPRLKGHSNIYFSLSHCHEAAACVVDRVPVGIDVESLSHYDPAIAERVMSDDEQRQIALSADPRRTFIRLWTMKESLLKMTGDGINNDLRHILQEHKGLKKGDYDFRTTEHRDFICTVCSLAAC